jgi:hypothetical protein
VLIYSERKVLLAGCWWLVCFERKVLVADKPSEQVVKFDDFLSLDYLKKTIIVSYKLGRR